MYNSVIGRMQVSSIGIIRTCVHWSSGTIPVINLSFHVYVSFYDYHTSFSYTVKQGLELYQRANTIRTYNGLSCVLLTYI